MSGWCSSTCWRARRTSSSSSAPSRWCPQGHSIALISLPPRFVGLHRRAARAELLRLAPRVLELRARVRLDEIARCDALEAVAGQEPGALCPQPSPRNSAGPEVDVAPARLADGGLERDVGDLDAPAGREDAEHLAEDGVLVRHEVDDAVRDDDVERVVREGEAFRLALDELDVPGIHL